MILSVVVFVAFFQSFSFSYDGMYSESYYDGDDVPDWESEYYETLSTVEPFEEPEYVTKDFIENKLDETFQPTVKEDSKKPTERTTKFAEIAEVSQPADLLSKLNTSTESSTLTLLTTLESTTTKLTTISEPSTTKSSTTELKTIESTTTQSTTTESTTTQSTTTESTTAELTTTELTTAEPPPTEPPTAELSTTEPPTTELSTTEPPTTELSTTEPPSTEPPTTELSTTEPPTTESQTNFELSVTTDFFSSKSSTTELLPKTKPSAILEADILGKTTTIKPQTYKPTTNGVTTSPKFLLSTAAKPTIKAETTAMLEVSSKTKATKLAKPSFSKSTPHKLTQSQSNSTVSITTSVKYESKPTESTFTKFTTRVLSSFKLPTNSSRPGVSQTTISQLNQISTIRRVTESTIGGGTFNEKSTLKPEVDTGVKYKSDEDETFGWKWIVLTSIASVILLLMILLVIKSYCKKHLKQNRKKVIGLPVTDNQEIGQYMTVAIDKKDSFESDQASSRQVSTNAVYENFETNVSFVNAKNDDNIERKSEKIQNKPPNPFGEEEEEHPFHRVLIFPKEPITNQMEFLEDNQSLQVEKCLEEEKINSQIQNSVNKVEKDEEEKSGCNPTSAKIGEEQIVDSGCQNLEPVDSLNVQRPKTRSSKAPSYKMGSKSRGTVKKKKRERTTSLADREKLMRRLLDEFKEVEELQKKLEEIRSKVKKSYETKPRKINGAERRETLMKELNNKPAVNLSDVRPAQRSKRK